MRYKLMEVGSARRGGTIEVDPHWLGRHPTVRDARVLILGGGDDDQITFGTEAHANGGRIVWLWFSPLDAEKITLIPTWKPPRSRQTISVAARQRYKDKIAAMPWTAPRKAAGER